jgi:hypothetical protein
MHVHLRLRWGCEMNDELMAEEVEIDPLPAAAAFAANEHLAIGFFRWMHGGRALGPATR